MENSQTVIVEAVADFTSCGNSSLHNPFPFKRGTRFTVVPTAERYNNDWICVQSINEPRRVGYVPVSFVRLLNSSHSEWEHSYNYPFRPTSQPEFGMERDQLQHRRRFLFEGSTPLSDDQLPPRDYDNDGESGADKKQSRAYRRHEPQTFLQRVVSANEVLAERPAEVIALKSAVNRELAFEARRGFPIVHKRNELEEILEKHELRKHAAYSAGTPTSVKSSNLGSPHFTAELSAALRMRTERRQTQPEANANSTAIQSSPER